MTAALDVTAALDLTAALDSPRPMAKKMLPKNMANNVQTFIVISFCFQFSIRKCILLIPDSEYSYFSTYFGPVRS